MSAKALATVLFTAVGLYAVVLGISCLRTPVEVLVFQFSQGAGGSIERFCTALAAPCLLFGFGALLIFRPPQRLMERAAPDGDPPEAGLPQARAILVAGMALIGVFLLGTAGPRLLGLLGFGWLDERPGAIRGFWTAAIVEAVQSSIGVYLLFGAPRICRWLMKRIRESSAEGRETLLRDESGPGGGTG